MGMVLDARRRRTRSAIRLACGESVGGVLRMVPLDDPATVRNADDLRRGHGRRGLLLAGRRSSGGGGRHRCGLLDIQRGLPGLEPIGAVLNDGVVGFAAVAGRLLIEANKQLSLAREQIARLAVGEERLRFARDLHDLLGHSLSVIALKSELAGRLIKASPGLAAHEVEDIEKVARDALREVREAVAGYRQPTLAAELAGAHEALTAAGIEDHVDQDHAPLPTAVEAVLAWTVREGVTNVMRHSQAKRCAIRITNQDGRATVEVVDNGRGGTLQPGRGPHGPREAGLERGGTLTAEPLPHEGFRLRVTLPLAQIAQSTPPHPPPTPGG